MFFEYALESAVLPLSYSIEHRFGQRSHKGNGREFTANVFERVPTVVKVVIDNEPAVVRRGGPNVGVNRLNASGRVVDIAQRGQVFARINVGGNACAAYIEHFKCCGINIRIDYDNSLRGGFYEPLKQNPRLEKLPVEKHLFNGQGVGAHKEVDFLLVVGKYFPLCFDLIFNICKSAI